MLYRNPASEAKNPSAYIGIVRVREPGLYWAQLSRRTVRGKAGVELAVVPKT